MQKTILDSVSCVFKELKSSIDKNKKYGSYCQKLEENLQKSQNEYGRALKQIGKLE
jgi:hypothetical protein